jgi:hypothetical protein
MKNVRMRIDASKLKELTLSSVKGTTDSIALLKASRNLERLSLCDLPCFDMSKIIDDWRKVHKGFPSLRFLSIDFLARHMTMNDLEKLDLDEMYCGHIPEKICKGQLPSMRTLRIRVYNHSATETIPSITPVSCLRPRAGRRRVVLCSRIARCVSERWCHWKTRNPSPLQLLRNWRTASQW